MPITITMPRLSDTMEEGTLNKWHVKVGDKVRSGDHLADVETDKATMELQSYDEGTVARIVVEEGATVAVGKAIVILAAEGESVEEAAKAPIEETQASPAKEVVEEEAAPAPAPQPTRPAAAPAPRPVAAPAPAPAPAPTASRIVASPLARKMALEHGLDLSLIPGSGPNGRVIKRDILAALEKGIGKPAPAAAARPERKVPSLMIDPGMLRGMSLKLTNMRKTIARRLVESKTQIPHFTVTVTVDMDPLMGPRGVKAQLETRGIKLSVNDFIVRACVLALIRHQDLNSTWAGETIEQHDTINIGVAVALPAERGGGLVVPTLYNTHLMDLPTISSETRRLAKKAREQGLTLEEMSNGTFTVSNLGMYGVEHFEAIINPPQAAILAVGATLEKPVVRDGQIVIGREMALTLSADHRVVDGATAAEFMQTLRQLLENPVALLV